MNSWKPVVVAALLFAAPLLSGCGGIDAGEDETFLRVQRDLQAARADPEIRRHAPAALTVAGDMLSRAQEAEDVETLHRLAFTAQQQVDLARQLTEARQREERLMTLMEKSQIQPSAPPSASGSTANRLSEEQYRAEERYRYASPPPDLTPNQAPNQATPSPPDRTATAPNAPTPERAPIPRPTPDRGPASDTAAVPDSARGSIGAEPDPPQSESSQSARTGRGAEQMMVSELRRKVFGTAFGSSPSFEVRDFAPGEADLPVSLQSKLRELARLLELQPQRWVSVGGYANDHEDLMENLKLSDARAEAVKQYLVAQGIDPQRIWAIGVGNPPSDGSGQGAVGRGVRIALRDEPFRMRHPRQ